MKIINICLLRLALMSFMMFFPGYLARGQEKKFDKTGCSSISSENRPLYITYEGFKKATKENKDAEVLLRLHNNSSCSIEIITLNAFALTKYPDGRITSDMPQEKEIVIGYQIEKEGEIPTFPHNWGDETISSDLISNRSVLFSVPQIYFKNNLLISIPFNYKWETEPVPGAGTTIHRIYFESSKLPDKLF